MKTRLLAILLGTALALMLSAPAQAHDDAGVLEVTAATPAGDLTVDYLVSLIYSGDREPVADASITVVADGPAGRSTAPQALSPTERSGEYQVSVVFPAPGEWNVRFSSVTPRAALEHPELVSTPATTETTTTTEANPLSTIEVRPVDTDDDGSNTVVLLLAAAVVATVVVAAATVFVSRRRRS